jgi:hypothetical protein
MDVVDTELDAMQAQRVGRRALRLGAVRRGGLVPVHLDGREAITIAPSLPPRPPLGPAGR